MSRAATPPARGRGRGLADLTAVAAMLTALAYRPFGNLAHELIGTAILAFALVHLVLNRRWWRMLARTPPRPAPLLRAAANLAMAGGMLALAASSLRVSREVFGFLGIEGGIIARDLHIAIGWWMLLGLALHLGANWARLARLLPAPGRFGAGALRLAAIALACAGPFSAMALGLPDKLLMRFSFEMWDWERQTPHFFAHLAAVLAMVAVPAHLVASGAPARLRADLRARLSRG